MENNPNLNNDQDKTSLYKKHLIIGAGFGRTGTVSLKKALEILGFGPCYHMKEVFNNDDYSFWVRVFDKKDYSWEEIFQTYNSTTDQPACYMWDELLEKFPNSKVILTTRNSDSWLKSYKETVYNYITHQPLGIRLYSLFSSFMRRHNKMMDAMNNRFPAYCPNYYSDEKVIKAFEDHNKKVIESCPKEKLLVFDLKDGWEPLCKFLGKEIPDVKFPHINDTNEFRNHIQRENRIGYFLFSSFIALVSGFSFLLFRRIR